MGEKRKVKFVQCWDGYQTIKDIVDKRWIQHTCQEVSCKNRFVVVDGNENLYRYSCAAEFTHIDGGKAGMFYFIQPCGIRLSHYEMHTAESLSQVFFVYDGYFYHKSRK